MNKIIKDITFPTFHDLEISMGMCTYIEPRMYFGNKKDKKIYIYETDKIISLFEAYNS